MDVKEMEVCWCGSRRVRARRYSDSDDELMIHGLDLGPHVRLIHERGDWQVWHAPSHKLWRGLGLEWGNAPAQYHLMHVIERLGRPENPSMIVEHVRSLEPGPGRGRIARRRLIIEANDRAVQGQQV